MAAVAAILLAAPVGAGAEPVAERQPAPPTAEPTTPAKYVPVMPQRVLDTRNFGTSLGPNETVTLDLAKQTAPDATAVVLNVTGTEPTADTFVTVYRADEPVPGTSNLNLRRGQTRANAVTVAVSPLRAVTLDNFAGEVHLVVDLVGYYSISEGAGYQAHFNPQRMLDTRSGAPVGPGGVIYVDLGLPSWFRPTAVTLNVTAVDATTNTFVSAYTAGRPVPATSSLNLGPGEAVPNQVIVPLDTDRRVNLFNRFGNVHLIVDVVGYYVPGDGDAFVAIPPNRRMDTRLDGSGLRPDAPITLGDWAPEVKTVVANLTGTNATAAQHVVVWPGVSQRPNASNLNLVPGQTAANAVTVGVDFTPDVPERSVKFANNAGYVDVIFDVVGYFVSTE
ncbi:hypothetical protein [Actinophytocola sp.]|uniref:hypothetical protein n=1 Tax=Actinophytocola sp. TaxID=1872138 RepID=UPI002ED65A63